MNIKNIFSKLKKCRVNFDITIDEMNDILRNNKEAILLDVRSPQEYFEGHLNNAINIPSYELCSKVENLSKNKDTIILVYCLSGKRSEKACKFLEKCGYKNVYNLKGGIENN